MRLFSHNAIAYIFAGNTSAPIRNLTTLQTAKITSAYFLGFNQNLS
ncbi:hypothetical protein [Nostoc sp. ChiQUE01b]|nr:hypothetical protein [Nostoc sp. ChiQUE01b]MDZ8257019.1 hypothetical protein [Nostoc sp. ChiQUE01b]